jgi:hypothetical protein
MRLATAYADSMLRRTRLRSENAELRSRHDERRYQPQVSLSCAYKLAMLGLILLEGFRVIRWIFGQGSCERVSPGDGQRGPITEQGHA